MIAGITLKNLPVYEHGGNSLISLLEQCKVHRDKSELVGRPTFMEIAGALTKKGETLTGLCTYFVRLRHLSNVFKTIMQILILLVRDNMSSTDT